jgi:hypothetical protein
MRGSFKRIIVSNRLFYVPFATCNLFVQKRNKRGRRSFKGRACSTQLFSVVFLFVGLYAAAESDSRISNFTGAQGK